MKRCGIRKQDVASWWSLAATCLVLSCSSTSSSSSSSTRPAANPGHRRYELVTLKPHGSECPSGMWDAGWACASCDLRSGGDCRALCEHGKGDACALLAYHYEYFENTDDGSRARSLFERACSLQSALGCEGYADFLERGIGGKKDESRALVLYEKMCAENVGSSCKRAGDLIRRQTTNADLVVECYRRSCELDAAEGCSSLVAVDSLVLGVSASMREWAKGKLDLIWRKQCATDNKIACKALERSSREK